MRRKFFTVWAILITALTVKSAHSDSLSVRFCQPDISRHPILSNTPTEPGIISTIVEQAATSTQITAEFKSLPWLRCLQEVSAGHADAIFPMARTPKREKKYAFPVDDQHYLFELKYNIFIQKGGRYDNTETLNKLSDNGTGWNFNHYRTIQERGISAPLGFVTYEILKDNDTLIYPVEMDKGLLLVSQGRLDGFAAESLSGQFNAKQQHIDHQIKSATTLHASKEHVTFNPEFYQRNKQQLDVFWRQLEAPRKKLLKELELTQSP